MFGFYTAFPEKGGLATEPNRIVAKFIAEELPTGLRGVLIAGVLAASMSTISAVLNSLATVTIGDFFPIFNRRAAGMRDARWLTLAYGALVTLLACFGDRFGNLLDASVRVINLFAGKFSTVNQNGNACSLDVETIAVTMSAPKELDSACTFVWLPYAPGGVNYYEGPDEVVSGLFTGCYMSFYTVGGKRRVAHVNTGSDAPPDCKDFFMAQPFAGRSNFKPFSRDRDSARFAAICTQTKFGSFGCAVLGLVDPNNICYSVFLKKLEKCDFEVADVIQQNTTPGLS